MGVKNACPAYSWRRRERTALAYHLQAKGTDGHHGLTGSFHLVGADPSGRVKWTQSL
jgi:hypothetical protein